MDFIYPESQCWYRAGRGTVDVIFAMIFVIRKIQEKCIDQNLDLYMMFINLTKAFDTVNSDGLWTILHEGMLATVYECGELSKLSVTHFLSPFCSPICYWMPSRTWIRACTYRCPIQP